MCQRALVLIAATGLALAAVPRAAAQPAESPLHADRATSALVHGQALSNGQLPVPGSRIVRERAAAAPRLAGMAQDSAADGLDLTLAAFLGVVGGMALGAWVGPQLSTQPLGEVAGFILGTLAGSAVGPPLAVHLANDQRGSLAQGIGAGVLVAAAGLGAAALIGNFAPLLIVPAVQMGMAVSVERRTSPPMEGGGAP